MEPNPTPPTPIPEPLSDGGKLLAAQLSEPQKPSLGGMVYGGVLGLVAIAGVAALGISYLPTPVSESQAAAAEATQRINYFEGVDVSARAAFVYDTVSGEELYAKNANLQLPLASISKVMLALAVSEVLPSNSIVPISHAAVEKGGGGLTWGEEWLVKDLIDYTLLVSSNTGAEALAETADAKLHAKYPAAPRGQATVWRMNAIAQELGLHETYFINASGLDESATQAGALGSASDIAKLFAYALTTNSELFKGTTLPGMTLGPLNFPNRQAHNTNDALADIPGIRMGKTGTTDLAGGNLAVAFEVDPGRVVVAVVLGATPEARYADVRLLVERARKIYSGAN